MKRMNVRRMIIASLACLMLILLTAVCLAADASKADTAILDKLLKAVEANDYNAFVADGTDAFKAGLTKQMLQGVSAQLSPRMKMGYTRTYLGELKQQGSRVLLWKLSYSDGGDDTLTKLVLKDGKVAGFWLQ